MAWPQACGRPTPAAPSASRARCGTARCGSTSSASTPRPRNGAVSASPVTAASSDPPGWLNTKSSNISGRTPHRRRWTGSATERHLRTVPTTSPVSLLSRQEGFIDMTTSTSQSGDSSGMEDFGYKESLDRSIGKFASFAAGVSYISILTGTFQLFYFGFGTAGPAYLWSWPMVFVGQMAVALCFMELAAKYPVAGSVYNWSKQLGSRIVGWSSGWLMLTASIVTLSAVVLALQLNLPRLWSGFQIIGDGSTASDFAL